jgi:hypothetical protein
MAQIHESCREESGEQLNEGTREEVLQDGPRPDP